MKKKKFADDLKISLRITSYILSSFMLLILFLSFFFPDVLLKLSPVCVSKTMLNEECFMCGTTRAFIEASRGNFTGAASLNKFSPLIFLMFVFSGIYFFYSITSFFYRSKTFSAGFRKEVLK